MRSGFQIEHQCPQCGAPAILEETDRLFTCDFCRVKSYLVAGDVFRYAMPNKTPDRELMYFPYWRFKGALYSCVPSGVSCRIVDVSRQGVESRFFPVSIGLRAQTLRLRFATPEIQGQFVQPSVSSGEAIQALAKRFSDDLPQPIFHQEFLGETLSLIYSPFYLNGKVFDAVLDRAVSAVLPEDFESSLPSSERAHWHVDFVPAICPHCGWDLEGERDSLTLLCRNCNSTWKSSRKGIEPLEFGCLPYGADVAAFLPFWRIEADVSGIDLASYADLVKVANLPKVVQESWKTRPFHFWAPAFKVRPQLFLRLARSLTLCQPGEEPVREIPELPTHPVTLPIAEAIESMKVVLAHVMRPPESMYSKLPGIGTTARKIMLIYIPFRERTTELIQPTYKFAVNKNALEHGLHL